RPELQFSPEYDHRRVRKRICVLPSTRAKASCVPSEIGRMASDKRRPGSSDGDARCTTAGFRSTLDARAYHGRPCCPRYLVGTQTRAFATRGDFFENGRSDRRETRNAHCPCTHQAFLRERHMADLITEAAKGAAKTASASAAR